MNRILIFLGITIGLSCFWTKGAQAQIIACTTEVDSILHKVVYLNTDKPPEPTEGYNIFQSAIVKQIKLDKANEEYTGRIVVAFVVETNGRINGIRAIHNLPNMNHFFSNQIANALKLYKSNWKPGLCNGKPVAALVTIPFHINIHE